MKIGSAVPPPKAEGVKNKRPQLAIDQVFKTLRSGLKIYVERSGDGPKVVKGSQVKVHYDGWLAEDSPSSTAAGTNVAPSSLNWEPEKSSKVGKKDLKVCVPEAKSSSSFLPSWLTAKPECLRWESPKMRN